MDIKEIIRLLRRHWVVMIFMSTTTFVILHYGMQQTRVQSYTSEYEVHFPPVEIPLTARHWIDPMDLRTRIGHMLRLDTLVALREDLERRDVERRKLQPPVPPLFPEGVPPVRSLLGMYRVEATASTDTLLIRATATSGELAKELRDRLVEVYREGQRTKALAAFEAEIKKLSQELADREQEETRLKQERQVLQERLRVDHDFIDAGVQTGITASLLSTLEAERQRLLLEIRKRQAELRALEGRKVDAEKQQKLRELMQYLPFHAPIVIPPDRVKPEHRAEREKLQRELDALIVSKTEKHPDVVRTRQKLWDLERRIQLGAGRYVEEQQQALLRKEKAAEEEVVFLKQLLTEEYARLNVIIQNELQVKDLDSRIAAAVDRQKAIRAELSPVVGQAERHAMAVANGIDVTGLPENWIAVPMNRPPALMLAVVALLVGGAAGFLVEKMQLTLHTTYDVETHMNVPVLGMVPFLREQQGRMLTNVANKTPLAELHASIAIRIQKVCATHGAKVLLITSARRDEGKTTTACNLSIALARAGMRVILVDADLRKGSLYRLLQTDNQIGLVHLLRGELEAKRKLVDELRQRGLPTGDLSGELADCLQKTSEPNLRLLTAGTIPQNPVELLNSEHLEVTFARLREECDLVVVDSPPILSVIDSGILTRVTDLTLLITAAGLTTKTDVRQLKRSMEQFGARICGVVLNKAKQFSDDAYYYYYPSYYPYGYGSRRRGGKKKKV